MKGLDPAASLADNAERIVRTRLDELYSFTPKALNPKRVKALHDMRIAAKRLRYVLEITSFCFGPYASTATKRAKELQDLLGEIHDCDVQLPRIMARMEELRAGDARTARMRAPAAADDLDPKYATRTSSARAWRGLETMAIYLKARRELLFERFLELWTRLERDGFRARLTFAASERPEPLTPPSHEGNATRARAAVASPAPSR
ncbi:MAG: CHAD domain-containing protein [Solirubrobacteraceae bacterium]